VTLGAATGAAAAALGILAGPASASTSKTAEGFGSFYISGVTHQAFAAQCGDLFQGPVTSDDGSGDVTAKINQVSIDNCNQGIRVTANALPWTLTLQGDASTSSQFTLQGVDLNVTTAQGTCRYTGTLGGNLTLPGQPGLYFFSDSLSRQTAGCGGNQQITVFDDLQEIF
jgi:hypothetical protein